MVSKRRIGYAQFLIKFIEDRVEQCEDGAAVCGVGYQCSGLSP